MSKLKSTFRVSKMDCPSEEQIIRMQLEGSEGIDQLIFDIPGRKLEVIHSNPAIEILTILNKLELDTSLIKSEPCEAKLKEISEDQRDKKLLWTVLVINAFCFILEEAAGYFYSSVGLMSDGLDMLADCLVYGLALIAIGNQAKRKDLVKMSGYFQLALAVTGITEVLRRVYFESGLPDFSAMILVSFLALIGNTWCLILLQKSTSKEIYMKASMIFTSTDILVNIGVMIAAAGVYLTASRYPDLVVGAVVFFLVTRGAIRILKL